MAGSHRGGLHAVEHAAAGSSPVHRLDARVKLVALLAVPGLAIATPEGAWAAYAAYLLALVVLVAVARLPAGYVLRRMTVEIPFLVAAALVPVLVPDGAVRGGTLALRITIGVLAMVVLSSTTPFPKLLVALQQLKVPGLVILIVGLMWRYLFVLTDQFARMRRAQRARGYQPRWLWQSGALGGAIGALFVRSLERGERVHLAMLARGSTGTMPAAVIGRAQIGVGDVAFLTAMALGLVAARMALA